MVKNNWLWAVLGRAGCCLVLFVVSYHAEGSAATHAPNQRQSVREPIQPHRLQRTNGPSFVPDMTRLFAGASAAEEVLKQESGKLTVLVVWEAILPSDWSRPTRPVMARIPDNRVIQFWDKDHLIAEQLSRQLRTKQPNCCRHSGPLWDLVALYPNGANWKESEPFYVDGPVYKVESELENQTSKLLRSVNAINASSAKPFR
jgi:hypothetical protein